VADHAAEPTRLEPVPEDWDRALAVVAHPDDLEYGAAAAVARWTAQGKHVSYCLVTSGEAGIDSMDPARCATVRQDEQRRAAALVGVDEVEFLGHPDGTVVADLVLRRDLAMAIRRHRPDVLISINHRPDWGPGSSPNQADHRAVGVALIDAARAAGNRWVFPGAGGERWDGVRFVLFGGSPDAGHAVDVTATFEAGVASLAAHAAYLDALPEGALGKDPEPMLRGFAEATGPALGVALATSFELVSL
jgi:LmbE family N-acetylglucosaminyl deacetylase